MIKLNQLSPIVTLNFCDPPPFGFLDYNRNQITSLQPVFWSGKIPPPEADKNKCLK